MRSSPTVVPRVRWVRGGAARPRSASVVELPLLVDGRCGGNEERLGRDVGFQRGGPADDGAPVGNLLLLAAVTLLAREVPVGYEGVVDLAGAAGGIHACQERGRLVGHAVPLAEAVLAWHHPRPSSASAGRRHQRVPLGGVPPLQRGLVVRRDVRRDVHASGQAVSGQRGGAVVRSRFRLRDLRLDAVGERQLSAAAATGVQAQRAHELRVLAAASLVDVLEQLVQRGHLHHLLTGVRVRLLGQDAVHVVDFALFRLEVAAGQSVGVREDLLVQQGRAGPGAHAVRPGLLGIVAVLVLLPLVPEGLHALYGKLGGGIWCGQA